jgi:hypothetical protein
MHPKIIFVEGHTAVGKGYFIDNFTKSLDEKYPNLTYDVLRAADFALGTHSKSEDRKYTKYMTEDEKKPFIFLGHLELLTYLHESLLSTKKDCDLIIVDRSFLSFLAYNLYPGIKSASSSEEGTKLIQQKNTYINLYNRMFLSLFNHTPTLMVKLVTGIHSESTDSVLDSVNIVKNRIAERSDNKPINEDWLISLVHTYKTLDTALFETYSFNETVESGSYNYILGKYF